MNFENDVNEVKIVGTVVGTDWHTRKDGHAVITYRIEPKDFSSEMELASTYSEGFTCFAVEGNYKKDSVLFSESLLGKKVAVKGRLYQCKSSFIGWESRIILDSVMSPGKYDFDGSSIRIDTVVADFWQDSDSIPHVLFSTDGSFDTPFISGSFTRNLPDSYMALLVKGNKVRIVGELLENRSTDISGKQDVWEDIGVRHVLPCRSKDIAPVKKVSREQESDGMEW